MLVNDKKIISLWVDSVVTRYNREDGRFLVFLFLVIKRGNI